jgi:hypothetical protein
MALVQSVNLAVRFLLELSLLVVFGMWGFRAGGSTLVKWLLGLGLPLLAAVLWGMLLAPAARNRLQEPWRLIAEVVLFGLAVAALFSIGLRNWGWALAAVFAVNRLLIYVWKQ